MNHTIKVVTVQFYIYIYRCPWVLIIVGLLDWLSCEKTKEFQLEPCLSPVLPGGYT
jgi:hypothetical protein